MNTKTDHEEIFMHASNSSLRPHPSSLRGFTLIELLVVIAIISVLIGITIPVVGSIRRSAQTTATRALIGQIDAACQNYYGDYQAYPGPIPQLAIILRDQSNFGVHDKSAAGEPVFNNGSASAGPTGVQAGENRLTGTENLVLALVGGLGKYTAGSNADEYFFQKDQMGLGPMSFNAKRPGRSNPYMQNVSLSEGKFSDDAGKLNPSKDTIIPEFIDSYSNPMPILYMRARRAGVADGNSPTDTNNNIVIDTPFDGSNMPKVSVGQYNLLEIAPYTQSSIGVGRTVKPGDYKNPPANATSYPHGLISINMTRTLGNKNTASQYPLDAYAYLTEPSTDDASASATERPKKHQARKKDQFILISAGVDRTYGTEDDVTNFGDVLP